MNKLTVNNKKTHYMLLHRTRIKHKVSEDRVHICESKKALDTEVIVIQ